MSRRRVFTILNKDLTDGFRDGRVFVALLMPIVLAVVYNITAPERNERPSSNIVIATRATPDCGRRSAGRPSGASTSSCA